jgi:hypothetical protein
MEPAGTPGLLPGGFPRFFPIPDWACRVCAINACFEIIPGRSTLLCRKDEMVQLPCREGFCPHGNDPKGSVIHRNRPALSVLCLTFSYPHLPAEEINLSPLEEGLSEIRFSVNFGFP